MNFKFLSQEQVKQAREERNICRGSIKKWPFASMDKGEIVCYKKNDTKSTALARKAQMYCHVVANNKGDRKFTTWSDADNVYIERVS